VWCFTYVMRGTPLLVQLFLLYYGLAQFEGARSGLALAALGLVLRRGGLRRSTPAPTPPRSCRRHPRRAGRRDRGRARLRHAAPDDAAAHRAAVGLRRSLPAYSNEVVLMLHGTALASVVTLHDLTGVAREVNATTTCPSRPSSPRRWLPADHRGAGGPVPRRRAPLAAPLSADLPDETTSTTHCARHAGHPSTELSACTTARPAAAPRR
jgi:hypothetical protein